MSPTAHDTNMQHFPIFLAMQSARVLVSGGEAAALAKLRLVLKTPAIVEVYCPDPRPEIIQWYSEGRLQLFRRALTACDAIGARLVYAADENPQADAKVAKLAQAAGVLVNIVDNLADSEFITPAMVDRAPVTVAIGTEGTAPVLARKIKADLEETLPIMTGPLARAAQSFRPLAETLPHGAPRRAFWADWFATTGPKAFGEQRDLHQALQSLLSDHTNRPAAAPRVTLACTGSPDPDLLVMKTRRALDGADVVVHDTDIAPAILELARREADFVALSRPTDVPPLHVLLTRLAAEGRHVLYLTSIAAPVDLAEQIHSLGCECTVIPGLSATQIEPHSTQHLADTTKERA